MLERAANFQNDAAGVHKKRSPSGIGRSRDEDLSFEQGFFVCGMQYLYAPSDISGRDAGADVFIFLQWQNCGPRDKPTRIDNRRQLFYAQEPFEEDGILNFRCLMVLPCRPRTPSKLRLISARRGRY